jgi:hypothetical protein
MRGGSGRWIDIGGMVADALLRDPATDDPDAIVG